MERKELLPTLAHGSLFSGIGGFDYTAQLMGWTNLFNCEIDPFCKTILRHYFPNAHQYTNIKTTDFSEWNGKVDVLSGGFPCQPFSNAGQRRGTADDRYLWPEMLRAIREIRPRWIVGENVLGIVNWNSGLVFEQVCADLETESYQVQPYILPACGVNAPHRRYRTFFVANRSDTGNQNVQCGRKNGVPGSEDAAYAQCGGGKEVRNPLQSQQPNGERADGDGSERAAAYSRGKGYERRGISYRYEENTSERTDFFKFDMRSGSERPAADSDDAGSGTSECGDNLKRTQAGYEWEQSFTEFSGFSDFQSATNTQEQRFSQWDGQPAQYEAYATTQRYDSVPNWQDFPTQSPVCGRNDGFSDLLDADAIYQEKARCNRRNAFPRWRTESIKGYGNAIVPPLVYRIFSAINRFEAISWEGQRS